jgi:glucuronosyltransferase
MSPYWLLVLALLPVALNDGAKILGMFPIPAKSHLMVHKALMLELARRGHEITMVSGFPENKPVPNYTDIVVKTTLEDIAGGIRKPDTVHVVGFRRSGRDN